MWSFETGTYIAVGLLAISNIMLWARARVMRMVIERLFHHMHEAAQRIEALERNAH